MNLRFQMSAQLTQVVDEIAKAREYALTGAYDTAVVYYTNVLTAIGSLIARADSQQSKAQWNDVCL